MIENMYKQSFGIEIEMCGISRYAAACTLMTLWGVPCTNMAHPGGTYDAWTIKDSKSRIWKFVYDGSISARSNEEKCELNSPPFFDGLADIEFLQEAVRALRRQGAEVNASCGIHIHIGVGEHNATTLRNLVNMVASKENLLTESLQILDNRRGYCRNTAPKFIETVNREKPKDMDALAEIWYPTNGSHETDIETCKREHYNNTRYHLLNLHSVFRNGTIEFRAFNSTLHAGKVKAYIQLCLAMSFTALKSRSCSPRQTVTDNPKYTFRVWLLHLGLIGDEFATARKHLLDPLPGNSAWRDADNPGPRRMAV